MPIHWATIYSRPYGVVLLLVEPLNGSPTPPLRLDMMEHGTTTM